MSTSTPTSHAFDQAIALQPQDTNLFAGATSDAYQNMVGPFGGVTAATLLNAVLQHPERIGEPISLTINFAGPVQPGAFAIEATPIRTNRSTQHWLLLQRYRLFCYPPRNLVGTTTAHASGGCRRQFAAGLAHGTQLV